MLNVYNGIITSDNEGRATVQLPLYFEVLNRNYTYQLTSLGEFAQAIIEREIAANRFEIRTDKPNIRISWQVTGVRRDRYAESHPLEVEQDKPEGERGRYLHPAVHGRPLTEQIGGVKQGLPISAKIQEVSQTRLMVE